MTAHLRITGTNWHGRGGTSPPRPFVVTTIKNGGCFIAQMLVSRSVSIMMVVFRIIESVIIMYLYIPGMIRWLTFLKTLSQFKNHIIKKTKSWYKLASPRWDMLILWRVVHSPFCNQTGTSSFAVDYVSYTSSDKNQLKWNALDEWNIEHLIQEISNRTHWTDP